MAPGTLIAVIYLISLFCSLRAPRCARVGERGEQRAEVAFRGRNDERHLAAEPTAPIPGRKRAWRQSAGPIAKKRGCAQAFGLGPIGVRAGLSPADPGDHTGSAVGGLATTLTTPTGSVRKRHPEWSAWRPCWIARRHQGPLGAAQGRRTGGRVRVSAQDRGAFDRSTVTEWVSVNVERNWPSIFYVLGINP